MRAEGEFERESIWSKAGRRLRRKRKPRGPGIDPQDRRAMEDFISTRTGVEAYVEPATLQQTPTVVLVASNGEWQRFALADEDALAKLARKHALPIYDASRVGYPKRMKDYRRE